MNRSIFPINTFLITVILALFFSTAQASSICAGRGSCQISQTPIATIGISPPSTSLISGILWGVSQSSNGWSYNYYVMNSGSNAVTSFTLPYFKDEQISSVNNPSGWSFETGNIDVFGFGQNAGYMRWTNIGTPANDAIARFSFLSPWAPGLAAFKYTQIDKTTYDGLAIDIPFSPLAVTNAHVLIPTIVPVPPALILFLTALAVLTPAARQSNGRNLSR